MANPKDEVRTLLHEISGLNQALSQEGVSSLDKPLSKLEGQLKEMLKAPFIDDARLSDAQSAFGKLYLDGLSEIFKKSELRHEADVVVDLEDKAVYWSSKDRAAGERDLYAHADSQKHEEVHLFLKMKDKTTGEVKTRWFEIGTSYSLAELVLDKQTGHAVESGRAQAYASINLEKTILPLIWSHAQSNTILEVSQYHYHTGNAEYKISPHDLRNFSKTEQHLYSSLSSHLEEFNQDNPGAVRFDSRVVNQDGVYTITAANERGRDYLKRNPFLLDTKSLSGAQFAGYLSGLGFATQFEAREPTKTKVMPQ